MLPEKSQRPGERRPVMKPNQPGEMIFLPEIAELGPTT